MLIEKTEWEEMISNNALSEQPIEGTDIKANPVKPPVLSEFEPEAMSELSTAACLNRSGSGFAEGSVPSMGVLKIPHAKSFRPAIFLKKADHPR